MPNKGIKGDGEKPPRLMPAVGLTLNTVVAG